jgi:hypothetical protein
VFAFTPPFKNDPSSLVKEKGSPIELKRYGITISSAIELGISSILHHLLYCSAITVGSLIAIPPIAQIPLVNC